MTTYSQGRRELHVPLDFLSVIGILPIADRGAMTRGAMTRVSVVMADKVTNRREAKVALIVASAWKLAREHGIAGVSLHALAREVGMRQPSLYEYFDSKHALYDAMFADGNRQLLERLDALTLPQDPRAGLKKVMGAVVAFALEDPARYELLFERHVPGFTPSPEPHALAEEALERARKLMDAGGL